MVTRDSSINVGDATSSVEWIPLADVHTDPRVNTRPVDNGWVDRKLSEGFDPDKLGVPIISARPDGTYVWLDGQNRGSLTRRAGWGDQKIQARVFRGLTVAQEAELFLGHNDNRQVKPVYKFLAKVTAGDPDAVAINQVVNELGWKISDYVADRHVTAVRSLEKIHAGDKRSDSDMDGINTVRQTLRVTTEAWGYKAEAATGQLLQGIGMVFSRYGDAIDTSALVKKLSSYPGGAAGVLGDARGLQQYHGGTVAHCISETVVRLYNKNRRAGALPEWRS